MYFPAAAANMPLRRVDAGQGWNAGNRPLMAAVIQPLEMPEPSIALIF